MDQQITRRGGFLADAGLPLSPAIVPADKQAGAHVRYNDSRGGFLRLLVVGALLQLLTFGFYRFWYITDIRRWLWQSIRVGEDALEYTGQGRELLIGFLVALAITTPLYVITFAASLGLEFIHPFLSLAGGIAFVIFSEFAIYRARRYRLTRTVFRGVRFWMDGSGWAYALRSFAWSLLTMATLGFSWPWHLAAVERYKTRHSLYGDLRGDFTGRGGPLFRRVGWIWVAAILGLVGVAWWIPPIPLEDVTFSGSEHLARLVAGVAAAAAIVVACYPFYVAGSMRWLIEGLSFGPIKFHSEILAFRFVTVYSAYFAALALLVALVGGALYSGWQALVAKRGIETFEFLEKMDENWLQQPVLGMAILAVATYLVFILVHGIVSRYFLARGIAQASLDRLFIENADALHSVAGMAKPASGLGEGLADAMDVGGI